MSNIETQVVVLGAGPGGYSAAFRAADLGKHVVLIERYPDLGGVCLNVGCIPSKALLHTAEVINEVAELKVMGVDYAAPEIDLAAMRTGKDKVVKRLTGGLTALAKQRKVQVVQGVGTFQTDHQIQVQGADGETTLVTFEQCIIAAGSRPVQIPSFPNDDPRLIDSTGALALSDIPAKLLIIGGGIIGLEMATVYATLGSQVDIVELQPGLMPGCDRDLVKPLQKRLQAQVNQIWLNTKVDGIAPKDDGLHVNFAGDKAPEPQVYDRVLVSVGRIPNGQQIQAEAAGVTVDERGYIAVDQHMRTNVPHILSLIHI